MKIVTAFFGVVLVIAGIIFLPLPLPFGAIFILFGTSLMVASVPRVRRWLKRMRKKHKFLNKILHKAESILPKRLAEPLHETEPDEAADKSDDDATVAADGKTMALKNSDPASHMRQEVSKSYPKGSQRRPFNRQNRR